MNSASRHRIASSIKVSAFTILFALTALQQATAEQDQENFHQQVALVPGGSVVVENGRGDVSIEGWDKPEMLVEAHKIFDGSGEDRERWIRETKILVEGDEHRRTVKVEYPTELTHSWFGWSGSRAVNLTIHLPRQVNAELKTDRGKVTLKQITGKLDIGSDRCDVEISDLDGELRIRGDRGDLKVRDSKIRGGIQVHLDRGSADIALRHFAGDSDLEVSRGDLRLTLPANASFNLDAERTRRSSVHTDFGVLTRGNFSSGSISGQVNGGGSTLRLRADRGDVLLRAAAQ